MVSIQLRKCSVFWKLTAYFPTQRSVLPITAKYSESHCQTLTRNFDLFNLHNNIEETDPVIGTPFVNYWRAADSLYDITLESEQLFKDKNKENTRSARLSDLAAQALSYAVTLREAEIPEKYWLPAIMDWLLFTWYKNRNLPVSYLLKLYDEYSKKELTDSNV